MKKTGLFLLFGAILGCESTQTKPDLSPPQWIHAQVTKGVVCQQNRGIYSITQAEQLAINQCLKELTDKKIVGKAYISKETQVYQGQHGESVQTRSQIVDHYQVQNAQEDTTISYQILGKYYDPVVEKVYVWVEKK